MSRYYGKYRALVIKVESDKGSTRIKVKCPSVLGDSPSAWCYPCVPFITTDLGKILIPPKVGDPVWVEFEGGELSKPIWVGTWR